MIRHLIGEQHVASEGRFAVANPATGQELAEVCEAGEAEVDAAVAAARRAFPTWASTPARKRAQLVRRLGEVIAARSDEIAALETADAGVPIAQTRDKLIPRAADNFAFFAEVATRVGGETYPVDDQLLNYTVRRPVGVAGLITPWNLPFMLATWKVAPAIALGNTVVLKPAELAPLTADLLGALVREAGIPAGVVNVVHGRGEVTGDALVRHPDVNVISFTGETTTGRTILERGGATLKRFSMELGGKSPLLVFADCDVERALDAAVFGVFSLNGQRCTANSRILVEDSLYDEFLARFAGRAGRLTVGDPTDPATRIGPLIGAEHLDRVRGYVELGQREGARLVVGGTRPPGLAGGLAGGHFLSATVLADVDNRMRVAQEEIFGPVACLLRFSGEDHAVALANDVDYGLAAYVWTGDAGRAHRVAARIDAGMVFVNSHNVRDLRTPFGGTKASGQGREGGEYSFEVYTEIKNVCVSLGRHHIPRWGV